MVLRTCARVAVRLCQHEHSFIAVWRSLDRRSGTRESSVNLNNNRNLQLTHRTWPSSHDVTWSRAIALLTAAPPRPPRINQWPVYSDPYRRDAFLSTAYASIASLYSEQRQDNADEGLPQTADASTSRREQKQTSRHHAARAIDAFVLPSSDGHIDVKRRRWKRSQWVEHVQALQYLDRPQDAQAETSSPPTDAASTQLQLSESLLDCVHELRRISIAKAGYSNLRMLDHVQVSPEHCVIALTSPTLHSNATEDSTYEAHSFLALVQSLHPLLCGQTPCRKVSIVHSFNTVSIPSATRDAAPGREIPTSRCQHAA